VDAVAVERVDGGLALLCGLRDVVGEDADRSRVQLVRQERELPERRGVTHDGAIGGKEVRRRCPVVLGGESEGGRPARRQVRRAREEGRRHADHCEDVVLLDQRARQVGVLRRRTAVIEGVGHDELAAVDAPWALTMSK